MANAIRELKSDTYADDIQAGEGILVVYFWAPWCGHCRGFSPIYETVAAQMESQASFAKVNCDEQSPAAVQCNVSGTPTIIIYNNGKETDRIVGGVPAEALKERIQKHLMP